MFALIIIIIYRIFHYDSNFYQPAHEHILNPELSTRLNNKRRAHKHEKDRWQAG